MTELIISEKPSAAKRIAEALADGKPVKKGEKTVSYYELSRGKKDIIVGCAVGHVYGLKEVKRAKIPVFDIEWVPSSEIRKGDFSKKYLTMLKKLAKQCDEFTVATDYDIEGEVIGLNVVRFAAKQKDASRMKFSTLTKDELIEAYEKKEKHLDWGQANAGETRHKLDWYYGINLSRALTAAIKKGGMFKLLSTGRVQGPALKLLVEREKSIKAFKPTPYWEVELSGKLSKKPITALHEKEKFTDEAEAKAVVKKTTGKEARVEDIKSRTFQQKPPAPFDLTAMQIEAYGKLKIPPKQTLAAAQELYTAGFISYPRTSSNQLPESIGYKKVLKQLQDQDTYEDLCKELLKKEKLTPNNGKKNDPAHPAIYPTGLTPKGLEEREQKLYDLIVRRFLATFADPAVKETVTYTFNCNEEKFKTKGTVTKEPGWLTYYGKHGEQKEEELPPAKKEDKVEKPKITKQDKETTPPKRYTEASIIKELEKRNLGTKATRAAIIDTLVQRSYVQGKQLEVTELGMQVETILEEHCPKITDEELTRSFEEEMEAIREEKKNPEEILDKAKKVITEIVNDFEKDDKLGEELKETFQETRDKAETLGTCPKCKEGMIKLRRGRFGKFAACDKYPDCKTSYSLPSNGLVQPTEEKCDECEAPKVLVIKKGKRPQALCINSACPTKKATTDKEGKPCPKCEKGKLAIKRSMYGEFLGCDQYPKCKHTERIPKEDQS